MGSPLPPPGILVTYKTAVATQQSCFRNGKYSILTMPPKQGLTSVNGGQECGGEPGFVFSLGSLGKSSGFSRLLYPFW